MQEVSAGGLVYQRTRGGTLLFLSILDRFGRWSLPKGKQEPGETLEETALREIQEETSIQGEIEDTLGQIDYTYFDSEKGDVQKQVTFFLVRALNTEARAQLEEIDGVVWADPETFMKRETNEGYDNQREIIEAGFRQLGL